MYNSQRAQRSFNTVVSVQEEMACVHIPVQNSVEEVRVDLDQLPEDASDIIDILKAEQAPLDLWLSIAREYFKQGKLGQFCQILEEGSSHEINEYYADVKYERTAILNALGAYYSYLGKSEMRQREKEEYFIQATKHYNKASRIDMHEPSTWVGKGQLLLAKGELEQASAAFRIVLEGDPDNVSALLGQASVEFSRGHFVDSLALYKRVLQVHPNCPAAVRLGIGHCFYKLNNLEKSRQAFNRVLQLDPENVDAFVAVAILDMQSDDPTGVRVGMERMQRAFEIYPYCPMALNYLANHFFFTGQHFLLEQLTETALAVTTHGPTRSHSYYNLARSYHSKGDFETASRYYWAAIKEINKPKEFVLPYFGLGQVQMKLGEIKNALSNFDKVLEVYPDNCEVLKVIGHAYAQLGQVEKAQDLTRKATKVEPTDVQAFIDLGDLLMLTDATSALDAFKSAHALLIKEHQDVPIELLNNIGVIHFERGELELAQQNFREALGDGIWLKLLEDLPENYAIDETSSAHCFKNIHVFCQLEEEHFSVELTWDKVTPLFNWARLHEHLNKTDHARLLYGMILFKYPEYVDAYLRLAAIARSRNNIPLSIELVNDALSVDPKSQNAIYMLGDLELKNDDWVKTKETYRAASDLTEGKDAYASLCLGNWNYFAALRNEKRNPTLEATHLEKAKELYTRVLLQHPSNRYAANGAAMVLAEKGHLDAAKDVLVQVQEAADGNIFAKMTDVSINLAHVHFAQGNFSLAIKMYQNCLQVSFGTDSQILLYIARVHYEAEQWQECKRVLLKAIHLAPSNYILRFNAGVALQKFSASALQRQKRTVDEVDFALHELENAVRLFSQLSASSSLPFHGFDDKKISTHIKYCKHLMEIGISYRKAAEQEEQQNRQRQEVADQMARAKEAHIKAEEQKRLQMEKRRQEEELRWMQEQEEHFKRVKEQWKSKATAPKRRDRSDVDADEGGRSEKRRKKSAKKRKEKGSRPRYETDDEDGNATPDQDEINYDEANTNYEEANENPHNDAHVAPDDTHDHLQASGLDDSDADDTVAEPSTIKRQRAWSESDEEGDGNGSSEQKSNRQSSPVKDTGYEIPRNIESHEDDKGAGDKDE